jgi:hypothetical protein
VTSAAVATNVSALLDRKIEETSTGLPTSCARHLRSISETNATTVIEYIAAMKSEVNLSDNYRKDLSNSYVSSPDIVITKLSKT